MAQPPPGPPPPGGHQNHGLPAFGSPPYPGRAGGSGPPSPGPGLPGAGQSGPAHPGRAQPEDPNLINGATTHGILGQQRIRHPWEIPLLITGIVLTVIAYIIWIIYVVSALIANLLGNGTLFNELWANISILPIIVQLAVVLPLFPGVAWWVRATQYAQLRATGVRMSPTQFPEGYRMVVEAAEQFGLRRVPDAYVVMGSGVVNAFAAGHGFRRFVVLHSDMFEIGGRSRDPEALRFVIGHEVGHLAAGHVSYLRLVFANVINFIPFLGPAYSRAQEYTSDNFGYAFAPAGAAGVMGVLAGGKYLNAEVNVNELADRAATDPSFFVHWTNWNRSHPVTTWRAHALRDRSKPGALWIRPSGALFTSPLPPGHVWSSRYPTPASARAMLDAADRVRPAGAGDQFGRFPGADYSARPSMRAIQTAAPLLSDRTAYGFPPGPYRDDARGPLPNAEMNPFGRAPQSPPE